MRQPFGEWGADLVLSGHQHVYERLEVNNLTYIINGMGGHHWLYEIENCRVQAPGSQVRYNKAHGVMIGAVSKSRLGACFFSVEDGGTLVDSFDLES